MSTCGWVFLKENASAVEFQFFRYSPACKDGEEDRDDDVDEHETATEEFTQLLSSPPEEAVDQVNVNPAAAALHSVAAGPVK